MPNAGAAPPEPPPCHAGPPVKGIPSHPPGCAPAPRPRRAQSHRPDSFNLPCTPGRKAPDPLAVSKSVAIPSLRLRACLRINAL